MLAAERGPRSAELAAIPIVSPVLDVEGRKEMLSLFLKILFTFFYLEDLFFREGKGGRKRGRETASGCLSHAPNWGTDPKPRHVP